MNDTPQVQRQGYHVAEMTRRVGRRDGWSCHYCRVPLVPHGQEANHCEWIEPIVELVVDHCGCGLHSPGEVCESPGGWVLPPGWSWPTLDHKVPRARNGSNEPSNLVLACLPCNRKKGTKDYQVFIDSVGAS